MTCSHILYNFGNEFTCDKPHYPYELPEGWCWTTLSEITSIIGDGLHGTPQYDLSGSYFFINGNNLANRKIVIKEETKRISYDEYIKYRKPLTESTILVSINGTIGNVGTYNGEKVILGKSACFFNLLPFLFKEYICSIIESDYFRKYALKSATGSTIKNVPLKAINDFYVPIPPLQEQKRIVDSIKHWLSFVDNIEENKENLQETIKQAKSKFLDLAIHGKLVPQDPTDEPASELLKRTNPKAEIACDNAQYRKLPDGWCQCTLKDIGSFESGYAFSSDEYKQNGIPLIRISNITNDGNIDLSACVYIKNHNDSKFIVHEGDLLIAMSGATTGKMGVYRHKTNALLNQRVGNLKCNGAWQQQYRDYFMFAKSDYILKIAYGGAQPNISAKAIQSIKIDLPPLNEQHRIVAKIEELFVQLDNITVAL